MFIYLFIYFISIFLIHLFISFNEFSPILGFQFSIFILDYFNRLIKCNPLKANFCFKINHKYFLVENCIQFLIFIKL